MSHDSDIDIGLRYEDLSSLPNMTQMNHWEYKSTLEWSGSWVCHYVGDVIGQPCKIRYSAYGVLVVFHIWYIGTKETHKRFTHGVDSGHKAITWCDERLALPDSDHMPLCPEEYFEWFYGKNWRIPNHDWSNSKDREISRERRDIRSNH